MQDIKTIHIYDTTQVLAVDSDGKQIAELQEPLILLWANFAEKQGFTVDGLTVICGRNKLRLFKTDEGYNFEVL